MTGSIGGISPVTGSAVGSLPLSTYSGRRIRVRSLSITATMPGDTPYAAAGPAGSTASTTTRPSETPTVTPDPLRARRGVSTPIRIAVVPSTMAARSIRSREMPMAGR